MKDDVERIATRMWSTARDHEQCVERIPDEDLAGAVRERVRGLAREDGVRVRTARLGDTVVVVRLDAAVWQQDTVTMRRKLTPE